VPPPSLGSKNEPGKKEGGKQESNTLLTVALRWDKKTYLLSAEALDWAVF
jgi:hypothetical protein